MSLFRCWYFLGVIVQVLGPILARCWFGDSNETTRFHQSDLRAAVAWPLSARAQQAPMPVIGIQGSSFRAACERRACRQPLLVIALIPRYGFVIGRAIYGW